MNTANTAVFAANLIGSTVAAAINVAAWRITPQPWRRLYGVIATLAAAYAASYILVLSEQVTIAAWSAVMRYVAVAAWALVWAAPAYVRLHFRHRQEAALIRATAEAVIAQFDRVDA